jgi:hypothetical protein
LRLIFGFFGIVGFQFRLRFIRYSGYLEITKLINSVHLAQGHSIVVCDLTNTCPEIKPAKMLGKIGHVDSVFCHYLLPRVGKIKVTSTGAHKLSKGQRRSQNEDHLLFGRRTWILRT